MTRPTVLGGGHHTKINVCHVLFWHTSEQKAHYLVDQFGHGFILCGTQSTKKSPTWYKTYTIVGSVSIPT